VRCSWGIKDWPKLEEAVDLKIGEQRKFVAWWKASVQSAGQPEKNSPRVRRILDAAKLLCSPAAVDGTARCMISGLSLGYDGAKGG
jgi:hypothetical protein